MRLSPRILSRLLALDAAFVGLFASSYLLYAYVANRPVVCGASSGCEIVRLSKWAYVFGSVPRPFLGVLFYGAIILLLMLRVALRSRATLLWRVMQLFVLVGVIESVALFFIQWKEIGAFCLWCLLSASASVALALTALFDRPVEDDSEVRSSELRLLLLSMASLSLLFLAGLWYLLR
jgi:uncharacterized membrane protein